MFNISGSGSRYSEVFISRFTSKPAFTERKLAFLSVNVMISFSAEWNGIIAMLLLDLPCFFENVSSYFFGTYLSYIFKRYYFRLCRYNLNLNNKAVMAFDGLIWKSATGELFNAGLPLGYYLLQDFCDLPVPGLLVVILPVTGLPVDSLPA